MPDILLSARTHGRRSFSVLHDPARVPTGAVPLTDGEYRPGLLDEIAALAELHPVASLDELVATWRNRAPWCDIKEWCANELAKNQQALMDFAGGPDETVRLVPIEAAADACLLIIDHLARDPQDDLDAMVVALNEAGYGEMAGEMVRRKR